MNFICKCFSDFAKRIFRNYTVLKFDLLKKGLAEKNNVICMFCIFFLNKSGTLPSRRSEIHVPILNTFPFEVIEQ